MFPHGLDLSDLLPLIRAHGLPSSSSSLAYLPLQPLAFTGLPLDLLDVLSALHIAFLDRLIHLGQVVMHAGDKLPDVLTEHADELISVLGLDSLFLLDQVNVRVDLHVQVVHLTKDLLDLLVDGL